MTEIKKLLDDARAHVGRGSMIPAIKALADAVEALSAKACDPAACPCKTPTDAQSPLAHVNVVPVANGKRVFEVDVGRLPPEQQADYVAKVKAEIENRQVPEAVQPPVVEVKRGRGRPRKNP